MTSDSWERKKGQLLFRALADFSDACEAPQLTPACPFFMRQPNGMPVCAEECKDILGDELSPIGQPSALDLGSELHAVARPRPRRRPGIRNLAFDARAIYLRERTRDVANWSMASLINGLKAQFAWMVPDPDDPAEIDRALAIGAEIEKRGVNLEATLRQGLALDIFSAVIWPVLAEKHHPAGDDSGWFHLFQEIDPHFGEVNADGSRSFPVEAVRCVRAWISSAPIEDLLSHRVRQSVSELKQLASEEELFKPNHDAVWLVERFTKTYVDRWNESSWHREWRYQHSQRPGCCPPGSMRERDIDVNEISSHLAEVGSRYLTDEEDTNAEPIEERMRSINPGQFVPFALDALERGDRTEAVSIFRMLDRVAPNDAQVLNNLGFCLLPDHPFEAVSALQRALEHPPRHLAGMMQVNLALGQYLCGDTDAARAALERGEEFENIFPCSMWDIQKAAEGEWQTTNLEVGSLAKYAKALRDFIDESQR